MGTYGSGNFDDDGAADLRAGILARLVADVEIDLKNLEVEDTWLQMGRIAILLGIVKTCGGMPPDLETLGRWRSQIIGVYDDEIDGLGASEEFKQQRRQVMEDTFQELEELAHQQNT